jgi:LmbE family N-acetylglucosaminyl deacetylase
MIAPITPEREWRDALDGLPAWRPPMVPTLLISPHPDDETLAAGGLLSRLTMARVEVAVAAVTDGERAYEDEPGLGAIREVEQAAALAVLGVPPEKIHRLRLPDSGLHLEETTLIEAIRPLAQSAGHVLAPWTGDFHPDHEVCGRAARAVAAAAGIDLTYYFFWTWHRGTPSTLEGLELVSFPLQPGELQRKNDALLCHRSQLHHPSGQPILPDNLLQPMQRPYEVFLPA